MSLIWSVAALVGKSLVALRIVNILLHVGNSLLFAWWLRRCGISAWTATWTALIVAAHPIVTEPVMWITGNHDLLATAGCLVALAIWPLPGERFFVWRVLAASVATLWAALCKEPYFVLPAVLACLLARPAPRRFRLLEVAALGGPVLAVCLTIGLRRSLGIPTGSVQLVASLPDQIVRFASIVGHYLESLLSFTNPATTTSFRPMAFPSVVLVVAIIAVTWMTLILALRRGVPGTHAAMVGWAWFLLALAPHVAATPAIGMYGNRYAYFPMMGLATAFAALVAPHVRILSSAPWRPLRWVAPVGILVATLLTGTEAAVWRDEVTLFGADVRRNPDDPKALQHFGNALLAQQGCGPALPYFARAVHQDPACGGAWHNIAGCLINLGRHRDALKPALMAHKLQPEDAGAAYNLAVVDLALGHRLEGMALLESALRMRPNHTGARQLLDAARKTP